MKELAFLLRVFLGAVLRAFFPAAFDEAKKSLRDTAEDARSQPELKSRLQKRIRERWRGVAVTGMLALVCFVGAGCGTRTLFVPTGDPVRIRKPIKNAAVWTLDADGQPVASTVDLPAGWYVLPDPGDDPAEQPPHTESSDPTFGISTPYDIPVVPGIPAPAPLFPLPPDNEETNPWLDLSTPNPMMLLSVSRSPASRRPPPSRR